MAINDTEELTVAGSLLGQQVVNTYHFRVKNPDLPGPPSIEQALIDAWQAGCYANYRGIFLSNYTIDYISARQVCGTLPLRARVDESVAATGTRAASGDLAPTWLAALVRERSAFAGRSYQGRNFYLVGAEIDFVANVLQANILTPINTYNASLLTVFGPSGTNGDFQLVIHSHKLASVPGTQCQNSSTPVLSLSTSTYLTTMRSRRSRSGA